jgi:hypothetical protein
MATKKNETALAVADNFQLMKRYEGIDPELLAELQDEMDDLDPESGITCLKIKIPSGGGLAYEVQTDEEDDAEYMKQIDGVVIFTHRANGFWPGAYGSGEDQNQPPACASMDGKTAIWTDTGELRSCEGCPYNEYGSGADQTGKQGRGKACKNMRRLYLMMSGDPNLYLLTVPPTSIKDVNRQLAKILAGGVPYTGMILRFTLEKATNANGVAYSKVVIKKGGILPTAIAAQAIALRRQVKEQYQSVAITLDDYTPATEQAQPRTAKGGVDVSPMSDEEWEALTGEKTSDANAPQFQDAPATGGDPVLPFD